MPIVDVNGQQIEFPDSMGQDEILSVLRKKFPTQLTQSQEQPQTIIDEKNTQKEGIARTVFDQGLQGLTSGFADESTDRLGAAIGSLVTGQPYSDMYNQARELTKERARRQFQQHPIASIASNVGGGLVTGAAGSATKIGGALGGLIKSGNLPSKIIKGAMAGAASGATYGAGSSDDGKRAEGAVTGAELGGIGGAILPTIGSALSKVNTKTIIPSSDKIREIGGDLFKKAEAMGSNLPSDVADKFRQKVLTHLNLDSEAKLYSSNPVAERLTKNIQDFFGQPLSFNTAKQIDEALGDLAYGTMDNFGKLSSEGKKFLDLQLSLRDAMDSVPENDIVREARKYWSASLRMREIERIIEKASSKEQPVTALKGGFNNLLNRGDKLKGYSTDEINAIKKAAKTGVVTDVVKLAGSGLTPFVSGTIGGFGGGGIGSVAGFAAGTAAQKSAKAIGVARQTGRANAALSAVANRVGLTKKQQRIPTDKLKQIMSLPPNEARILLEKLNQYKEDQ